MLDCALPSFDAGVTFPKRRINTDGRIRDGWLILDRDPADPYRPYLRRVGPIRAGGVYNRSFRADLQVNGQRIRRVVRFVEDCMFPPLVVSVNGCSLLLSADPPQIERCGNGPCRGPIPFAGDDCVGCLTHRVRSGWWACFDSDPPSGGAVCNPATASQQ